MPADMSADPAAPPTDNRIAIFERYGQLLEKFRREGMWWVSLADGRRLSDGQMAARGWVYVQDQRAS